MEPERESVATVLSYLAMRRLLGFVGILMPIVLLLYSSIDKGSMSASLEVYSSISAYYYHESPLNGFFVGSMCAIGIFLVSYRGHETKCNGFLNDNVVTSIAGIAALGVAIFPTYPLPGKCSVDPCFTTLFASLHYISAVVFLVALALMSAFCFSRGGSEVDKIIYRVCGYIIFAMILLVLIICGFFYLSGNRDSFISSFPIFWPEAVAVLAFGISWLTKGHWLRTNP